MSDIPNARVSDNGVLPETLDDVPFVDRVRSLIAKGLPIGAANMTGVAALLEMSPSTLRRKLAQEGTSHRALNQSVRISLASAHLEQDDSSVAEAAAVAGYDDVSSFHRAFKRWTGRTPAEHRAGRPVSRQRAG